MGKKRKVHHGGSVLARSSLDEGGLAKPAQYNQDDTFADSQDEFFTGKDQIMLAEGPARKRRKQIEEEERFLEPSDEEVLGYDDEDEEEIEGDDLESADEDRSESEAEEGTQNWGTSKADYYSADVIETEADALEEEAEARRLQQKQLQTMTEADFGFDESEWLHAENQQDAATGTVIEKLPDLVITNDMPVGERLKILRGRYPELEPLARDYTELQDMLEELKTAAKPHMNMTGVLLSMRKARQGELPASASLTILKWRALSTYMGLIAMYFAILTAPSSGKSQPTTPMSAVELRQHPVMSSLLKARHSWDTVKDLCLSEIQKPNENSGIYSEDMPTKAQHARPIQEVSAAKAEIVEPGETLKQSKKRKVEGKFLPEEKRPSRKQAEATSVLAELDNLIVNVKKHSTKALSSASAQEDSDFGDESALTAQEATAKAQRKKGLRFYTSQIVQKSNKRGTASRDAGGDADLPYKERLKDRHARLMRGAEKRGSEKVQLEQQLSYQDEDEDEKETARVASEVRGDAEEDNEYYQTILGKTKAKKADKNARAAAHAEAAKVGAQVIVEDVVGPDGKRGITYEISKNKGLMPRRKKEVRNPRVKKRLKYDEKMKKLGSIRQVYKGGEGKGGYGGELSGIKTNLVRSVKL